MTAQWSWKDYLIPGTDVLRNKSGLTTLKQRESQHLREPACERQTQGYER